jgi:hypothetical protein
MGCMGSTTPHRSTRRAVGRSRACLLPHVADLVRSSLKRVGSDATASIVRRATLRLWASLLLEVCAVWGPLPYAVHVSSAHSRIELKLRTFVHAPSAGTIAGTIAGTSAALNLTQFADEYARRAELETSVALPAAIVPCAVLLLLAACTVGWLAPSAHTSVSARRGMSVACVLAVLAAATLTLLTLLALIFLVVTALRNSIADDDLRVRTALAVT